MTDLARSLVDAAAEAIGEVILAKCPPNVMPTLPPGCTGQDLGEGAVAAVLDELAAHTAPTDPGGPAAVRFLNHDEFRRLAAEVKEGVR